MLVKRERLIPISQICSVDKQSIHQLVRFLCSQPSAWSNVNRKYHVWCSRWEWHIWAELLRYRSGQKSQGGIPDPHDMVLLMTTPEQFPEWEESSSLQPKWPQFLNECHWSYCEWFIHAFFFFWPWNVITLLTYLWVWLL